MPDNDWYEYLRKLLTVNQPPPNPSGQYRLPDIGLRMGMPGESAMTSNPRPNYRRSELESMDRLKDYGQPQPDPDAPIIRPGMSAMERMPPVSTVTSTTPPSEPDRIRPMPTGPMKPQAQRPTTVGRVGPSNQAQTQPQAPANQIYYLDRGNGSPLVPMGNQLPKGMSAGSQQGGGYIFGTPAPTKSLFGGESKSDLSQYPKADVPVPQRRPDDLGGDGMATGGSIDRASKIAREKATPCHSGIINMAVGGRTDHIPMNVLEGSYVLPADIVSGLGEGNTLAGSKILDNMFQSAPFGTKIPTARANPKVPALSFSKTTAPQAQATGGRTFNKNSKPVPIIAAGGEYVVHPDVVSKLGNGDMNEGHEYLDNFVKYVRAHTAKTLQNLPGPRKD